MSAFARSARLAGVLYLGIIVLGISAEAALRAPLITWGDAAATQAALTANEGLFRLSMLFDLGMSGLDVALAVVFFGMLRAVDVQMALLAMVFRLMQAAVIAGNILLLVAVLQGDALIWLERHAIGYDIGLAFFAVNTVIMARLLWQIAPRWICVAMGVAGGVYGIGSVTRLLVPDMNAMMQPAYVVPVIAEVSLMVWLLIWAPKRG
jgi:hypothetical protein